MDQLGTAVDGELWNYIFVLCVFVCFVYLLFYFILVQACEPEHVHCTHLYLSWLESCQRQRFMEVSTVSGEDDASVTDSQTSFTDLLKHLIMQDERRTEKELKHEQEKEKRDREWALQLEERREEKT